MRLILERIRSRFPEHERSYRGPSRIEALPGLLRLPSSLGRLPLLSSLAALFLLVSGLIGPLFIGPMAAAVDEDPLVVQLELELLDQEAEFANPSGLTIRIEPGELAILRLRVFEEGDPGSPVNVEDPTDLLEVRASDGEAALRIGDWNRMGAGVYETTYRFDESGTFNIIVLPDIEDRSAIPSGSTDRVTAVVDSSLPVPPDRGPSSIAIIAVTVLVLAVAALVVAATRGRSKSPKEPVPHDTWWNSP